MPEQLDGTINSTQEENCIDLCQDSQSSANISRKSDVDDNISLYNDSSRSNMSFLLENTIRSTHNQSPKTYTQPEPKCYTQQNEITSTFDMTQTLLNESLNFISDHSTPSSNSPPSPTKNQDTDSNESIIEIDRSRTPFPVTQNPLPSYISQFAVNKPFNSKSPEKSLKNTTKSTTNFSMNTSQQTLMSFYSAEE